MRRPPSTIGLGLLLLLVGSGGTPPGLAAASDGDEPRPRAGGRLIWDASDELDLLGDLWVTLPFSIGPRAGFFFDLETRTAIEKTQSDLTFVVRDLDYAIDLGWRRAPFRSGTALALFAGQQGKQLVDADGQPFVRYLGVGLDGRTGRRWSWRAAIGPVVQDREVDANGVVRGEVHYRRAWFDFDLELEGLIEGGRLHADIAGGPGVNIPLAGGHEARFFLHYQRSRNPLGIGHSALLGGFEYRDSFGDGPARQLRAPRVDGLLATGSGDDGRLSGELMLRVLSPETARRLRVAFLVDANVLTARDTGELYYLFHLGLERPVRGGVAGLYFYHRSNHQLAEPNPAITSINVLEAGFETPGWKRPGHRPPARSRGALEASARAGYLIDSAFGEDRRWHLRGGARWILPVRRARLVPYLEFEAEAGDVERETFAAGMAVSQRTELQIEHRSDDQFYSSDRDAWLLTVRTGF